MPSPRVTSVIALLIAGTVSVVGAATSIESPSLPDPRLATPSFASPTVSSAEARDLAEESLVQDGAQSKLSDWTCPSDSVSVFDDKPFVCRATVRTDDGAVRYRFRVLPDGENGWGVQRVADAR